MLLKKVLLPFKKRHAPHSDHPPSTHIPDEPVFFFGKDGTTTVLKAGPDFEQVSSNRFWSAADFAKRRDEAKDKAAATLPKPPEGKGPGGGPPLPKDELEATRYSAVGDVVYGVAAVDGMFVIRTGTEIICVRTTSPGK